MNTITQTTAREVIHAVPQVTIDYLWGLVEANPTAPSHTFLMTPRTMNGQEYQEMIHVAEDCGPAMWHKVFGFRPVSAAIRVLATDDGYMMGLYGPLEALGMVEG